MEKNERCMTDGPLQNPGKPSSAIVPDGGGHHADPAYQQHQRGFQNQMQQWQQQQQQQQQQYQYHPQGMRSRGRPRGRQGLHRPVSIQPRYTTPRQPQFHALPSPRRISLTPVPSGQSWHDGSPQHHHQQHYHQQPYLQQLYGHQRPPRNPQQYSHQRPPSQPHLYPAHGWAHPPHPPQHQPPTSSFRPQSSRPFHFQQHRRRGQRPMAPGLGRGLKRERQALAFSPHLKKPRHETPLSDGQGQLTAALPLPGDDRMQVSSSPLEQSQQHLGPSQQIHQPDQNSPSTFQSSHSLIPPPPPPPPPPLPTQPPLQHPQSLSLPEKTEPSTEPSTKPLPSLPSQQFLPRPQTASPQQGTSSPLPIADPLELSSVSGPPTQHVPSLKIQSDGSPLGETLSIKDRMSIDCLSNPESESSKLLGEQQQQQQRQSSLNEQLQFYSKQGYDPYGQNGRGDLKPQKHPCQCSQCIDPYRSTHPPSSFLTDTDMLEPSSPPLQLVRESNTPKTGPNRSPDRSSTPSPGPGPWSGNGTGTGTFTTFWNEADRVDTLSSTPSDATSVGFKKEDTGTGTLTPPLNMDKHHFLVHCYRTGILRPGDDQREVDMEYRNEMLIRKIMKRREEKRRGGRWGGSGMARGVCRYGSACEGDCDWNGGGAYGGRGAGQGGGMYKDQGNNRMSGQDMEADDFQDDQEDDEAMEGTENDQDEQEERPNPVDQFRPRSQLSTLEYNPTGPLTIPSRHGTSHHPPRRSTRIRQKSAVLDEYAPPEKDQSHLGNHNDNRTSGYSPSRLPAPSSCSSSRSGLDSASKDPSLGYSSMHSVRARQSPSPAPSCSDQSVVGQQLSRMTLNKTNPQHQLPQQFQHHSPQDSSTFGHLCTPHPSQSPLPPVPRLPPPSSLSSLPLPPHPPHHLGTLIPLTTPTRTPSMDMATPTPASASRHPHTSPPLPPATSSQPSFPILPASLSTPLSSSSSHSSSTPVSPSSSSSSSSSTSSPTPTSQSQKREKRFWSQQEIALLMQSVESVGPSHGAKWHKVAQVMNNGRSPTSCANKFKRLKYETLAREEKEEEEARKGGL